jgi:hypothetical protein
MVPSQSLPASIPDPHAASSIIDRSLPRDDHRRQSNRPHHLIDRSVARLLSSRCGLLVLPATSRVTIVSSRKDTDPVAHLDPTDAQTAEDRHEQPFVQLFHRQRRPFTHKDVLYSLGSAPSHLCSFAAASHAHSVLHPRLTTLPLCP